jgi:hypothetical protein
MAGGCISWIAKMGILRLTDILCNAYLLSLYSSYELDGLVLLQLLCPSH